MERTPLIEDSSELLYDGELEAERALAQATEAVEERLGKHLESAIPAERITVTTQLLKEAEERSSNSDRFIVEVYAGIKIMAELEQSFHEQSARLKEVLH